jgi:N-acetylmuramoyl-L-alanine amidase
MKNRGIRIRKDRIWMIYAGNFPSILIEWGYISNPDDLAIMKDPNAHKLLAQAIWFTVDKHFENNPVKVN